MGRRPKQQSILSVVRYELMAAFGCIDCGKKLNVNRNNAAEHKGRCSACTGKWLSKQSATHGMNGTPELVAYISARRRCTDPNHPSWKEYGGRGVKFLFKSFEQFYAEIGPRPEGKSPNGRALYSLDRIDNDFHYMPGNVRWATQKEQCNNRRPPRRSKNDVTLKTSSYYEVGVT